MKKTEPKTELADNPLKEFCRVCDRVAWGEIVVGAKGSWRHADCYGGSKTWLENYYRIQHPTDAQVILYETANSKGKGLAPCITEYGFNETTESKQ